MNFVKLGINFVRYWLMNSKNIHINQKFNRFSLNFWKALDLQSISTSFTRNNKGLIVEP